MQTTGNPGTVVGKGTNVTLQIFGVSCTYGIGEGTTLGTVSGGSEPEMEINASIPKTADGFLCPSTIVWIRRTWRWTTPHAVHIVS